MVCSSANHFRFMVLPYDRGRTLTPLGGNLQWQVTSPVMDRGIVLYSDLICAQLLETIPNSGEASNASK